MASAPPRSSRPLEGREFLAPGWLEARASAPRALPGGAPPPFLPLALGPYRIRRRIGAGGMGVVYEAFDTRKNERVALKTLELMDASGLYRLKNEFRSVADITHPNLVSLYELVCEGSTWFITMELVEGVSFLDYVSEGAAPRGAGPAPGAYGGAGAEETLRSGSGLHTAAPCSHARQIPARPDELPTQDRDPSRTDAARTVRSEPPPGMKGARVPAGALRGWERAAQGITSEPPPASAHRPSHARIRRALLQLASAVSTLHRAGKLHRDIKPANLLVSREGRVVVLDFGLAGDARGRRDDDDVEGTPGYMAPEQARGRPATPASDWYAVGGVLYQALTGRLPFSGSALDIITAKLRREPPPPSTIAAGVPPDLDALCVALLRRYPEERPDGREILARLRGAAEKKAFSSGEWAAARRGQTEPPSRAAAPLLGREAPLEALRGALAAVAPGAPIAVFVRGRSGMGKTALVQEFVRAVERGDLTPAVPAACAAPPSSAPARAAGAEAPATVRSPRREPWPSSVGRPAAPRRSAVVISSRCHERESVPFRALDGLVDALTRHLRELPDAECAALLPDGIAELAALFPVLERVRAVAEAVVLASPGAERGAASPAPRAWSDGGGRAQPGSFGAAQVRLRAFAAFKALLRGLARAAPLLLAIDDLHWGDRESAELLRALLSPPDAPGLLFIASYSTDAAGRSPLLRALLADPPCEARAIEVGPLPPAEAASLALSRLGRGGAGAEAYAAIVAAEAEGSPFLIEEIVRYARAVRASRGGEARRCPPPSSAPAQDGAELSAPTLAEVLGARLSALPAEARRLLEVVAAAGGPVPRRVALEAAEVGADAARALHQLCVGGLLRTEGVRDEDAVDTYHDRIRDRVLAALSAAVVEGHRGALARAEVASRARSC